ncbi:MAG: fluoride efflux transporter CrcB [Bacteroidetes bacterium]|nr:fluoride efflux transporter CrcB [Bacteroidota bacterium]
MNRNIVIVGIGGFLGTVARYLVAVSMSKSLHPFPLATFVINVVGCLVIGVIYGVADRSAVMTPEWRLFLATGFCGGFTTFSSFAYENVNLLQLGQYSIFALYTVGSVAAGLLAAGAGVLLSRQF